MTDLLRIENHGPLITATNFWESAAEAAGKLYLSINGGAFRLLVPRSQEPAIAEMTTGKEVIISRGPWPQMRLPDGLELLFEDGSDSPYALHLSIESADRLPRAKDAGKEWIFTAWSAPRRGRPHQVLQRPCWYRLVPKIPYLKPR
jgi:hypothetical protein